ncbi:hypothetical protein MIR68_005335 [Amoeboaphelidium protococcarum]|nr:hypothetical protein MIR68_005335 [Amoeboaphelidium protococcarum]
MKILKIALQFAIIKLALGAPVEEVHLKKRIVGAIVAATSARPPSPPVNRPPSPPSQYELYMYKTVQNASAIAAEYQVIENPQAPVAEFTSGAVLDASIDATIINNTQVLPLYGQFKSIARPSFFSKSEYLNYYGADGQSSSGDYSSFDYSYNVQSIAAVFAQFFKDSQFVATSISYTTLQTNIFQTPYLYVSGKEVGVLINDNGVVKVIVRGPCDIWGSSTRAIKHKTQVNWRDGSDIAAYACALYNNAYLASNPALVGSGYIPASIFLNSTKV